MLRSWNTEKMRKWDAEIFRDIFGAKIQIFEMKKNLGSLLFKILAHEKDIWKEEQKGCRGKGGANKVILPRHKTNKVI